MAVWPRTKGYCATLAFLLVLLVGAARGRPAEPERWWNNPCQLLNRTERHVRSPKSALRDIRHSLRETIEMAKMYRRQLAHVYNPANLKQSTDKLKWFRPAKLINQLADAKNQNSRLVEFYRALQYFGMGAEEVAGVRIATWLNFNKVRRQELLNGVKIGMRTLLCEVEIVLHRTNVTVKPMFGHGTNMRPIKEEEKDMTNGYRMDMSFMKRLIAFYKKGKLKLSKNGQHKIATKTISSSVNKSGGKVHKNRTKKPSGKAI